MRVCGLKPSIKVLSFSITVAPHAGVWIETPMELLLRYRQT